MPNLGLASDVNNTNFSGAINPDDVLRKRFYTKSVLDTFQSTQQGHAIYIDVVYIEIWNPGDLLTKIDRPMRESDKIRFSKEWALFNDNDSEQIVGTRLEEWPIITRSRAEDLKGKKFYTVEQIAGASDSQLQILGMDGPSLRQKARAFLEQAKNSAFAQQQVEELQKREQEIKDLKDTVSRLAGQLEKVLSQSPEAPKPKRKYTKRVKNDHDASTGPDNQ